MGIHPACKESWEAFVAEARGSKPGVLAVMSVYGTKELVHSMKLVFQWADGRIEFERTYHLQDGPPDTWVDLALEELAWLSKGIKLVFINEPLSVEHCTCCSRGLSRYLNEMQATPFMSESWANDSVCTIYLNPGKPSLALLVSLERDLIYQGCLHKCGSSLHYMGEGHEERVSIRRWKSVRTQAKQIIRKVVAGWRPGKVIMGTGDPDHPIVIPKLVLPPCWEAGRR